MYMCMPVLSYKCYKLIDTSPKGLREEEANFC